MAATVDHASLGPMTVVGAGSFGTVHRLDRLTVPGYPALAYKEFFTAPAPAELGNLEDVVDFHERLDARRRRSVDRSAAWPIRLVTRAGQGVVGLLMPLVPDDFFIRQVLPSGKQSRDPCAAQWLIVDPGKAAKRKVAVPSADDIPDRLVLCAKLAHVLGMLHRDGLVYGDLSHNNVLFATAAPPRIMLVDCDAATARPLAVVQGNTGDWFPPEIIDGTQKHQDVCTDRYKLALFILRCLRPGEHASQTVDPGRMVGILDDEGVALTRAGLGEDRRGRPDARRWFRYLVGHLERLTSPPTIGTLTVDRQVVREGHPVTVAWDVRGAVHRTLTTADGIRIVLDQDSGRLTLPVRLTGALVLSAENSHGEAVGVTDAVYVCPVPRITHLTVREPVLPGPDGAAQHRLADVLAATVRGPVFAPTVELPELGPVVSFPRFPDLTASAGPVPVGPYAPALPSTAAFAELLEAVEADAVTVLRDAVARSAAARPGRSPTARP